MQTEDESDVTAGETDIAALKLAISTSVSTSQPAGGKPQLRNGARGPDRATKWLESSEGDGAYAEVNNNVQTRGKKVDTHPTHQGILGLYINPYET